MASAKEFIQSPSMEVLETFKNDTLMQIAQKIQFEVKRTTRKHELKRFIVEQLVDEDVLPDSCLKVYKPLSMEPSGQFELKPLEIERELKCREFGTRERELGAQKYEKDIKHGEK